VTVAVVGAGLAGLRVCESLRQNGFDESITLIGAELHPPYSRPPLSKEVLRGAPLTDAQLRSDAELAELGLDVRLGVSAAALLVDDRAVVLSNGTSVTVDDVVIATGAAPRSLPGVALAGVHTLRTVDDCDAIRAALVPGARLVVIGAGFIGLEVAASARALGCHVTVVDVLPVPLDRVLDASLGAAVQALHEANGVQFRLGMGVASLSGSPRVSGVVLGDDSVLDADVVVVGIGVTPETSWLADSGLTVDDGVVCSAGLQAAPGIWAVGDLCRWAHPSFTVGLRVEHWTNATEQAQHVARSIAAGSSDPFETVPYFWSDQYDTKLQSLGVVTKGDETRVVVGALDEPRWTALVRSGDRLGGVVGLKSARHVMKLRPLLAAAASWEDALATFR
jgi:NADPH-dependent 2,4-dienoyl-CoA reductase/sulfur reductase-like enzyme